MMLVTDRTQTDVLLGTEKGIYGAADLNRVETAVAELSALAESLDIHCQTAVKTDWDLSETFSADRWPTNAQMARYLRNVTRLCEAVEVAAAVPPSMEHLTWEGANQIEQALLAVFARIRRILQIFQFSGELFAGEENRI